MKIEDTYEITTEAVNHIVHFLITAELPDIEGMDDELFLFLTSFYADLKKSRFKDDELYEHAELWKFISQWAGDYCKKHTNSTLDEDIDDIKDFLIDK